MDWSTKMQVLGKAREGAPFVDAQGRTFVLKNRRAMSVHFNLILASTAVVIVTGSLLPRTLVNVGIAATAGAIVALWVLYYVLGLPQIEERPDADD